MSDAKPVILALTGKGGVGKTSISAAIVKLLVKNFPGKRILAIDADPAVGLATVLHVQVDKTIDEIRSEIVELLQEASPLEPVAGEGTSRQVTRSTTQLKGEVKYRLMEALAEQDGYAFLAIGRPEAAGCYCKVNAYLKELITMVADQFDYVVIDGEAGIEQVNRRVMEKVTHLLLVTDASRKGCQVVQTIAEVAKELVDFDEVGVIANRIASTELVPLMDLGELPLLSVILPDEELALCDLKGENVMLLPEESGIVKGAEAALRKLDILTF